MTGGRAAAFGLLVGLLLAGAPAAAFASRLASTTVVTPHDSVAPPVTALLAPPAALPTDRVIVRFRPGDGGQSSGRRALGLPVLREEPSGITVLAVAPPDVPAVVARLQALPEVEYAEPDYRLGIFDGPLTAQESDDGRLLRSGVPLTGTISPATDVDTFWFDAVAGQRATIRLTRQSVTLDPYLRLFTPTGALLAWDDDSGGGLNALLPSVLLSASGPYRVEASSYLGASSGPYELLLTLDGVPSPTATRTATSTPGSPTPTRTPPPGGVVTPNDPGYGQQYGLQRIRAGPGWASSTGSEEIIIAIVDTGVDLTHPDLAAKIVPGWDFVNNDPIAQDDHGHGTHVAGIAAAITNNGLGIAGVSWGARILPVKVLNAAGSGYTSDVAAGIIWAADHGAKVINLSLGGPSSSATLESAVNYAVARGALVVAAAGNSGNSTPNYPAAYPAALAVAATDSADARASFSTFGPFVDIAAPGVSIASTVPTGVCDLCSPSGYASLSGTSMATPHVAGVAAVLAGLAGAPTSALIRAAIESTALDRGPAGRDDLFGHGVVQLDAAIRFLEQGGSTPTPAPSPTPTASRTATRTPPTTTPTSSPTATPSPSPTALLPPVTPIFTLLRPAEGLTSSPVDVVIEGRGLSSITSATLRHAKTGAFVPLLGVRAVDATRLFGVIPAGLEAGAYDLVLTNPGAPETVARNVYRAIDPLADDFLVEPADLWTLPARLYAGTEAELGVNIRRRGVGPATRLPVRFYEGAPDAGGRVIADLTVSFEARARFASASTPWSLGTATGPVSVTVVLDPDGAVPEGSIANNRASRTLFVHEGGSDTAPPVVASLVVNGGAPAVDDPVARLALRASDPPPGSGLAWLLVVELALDATSGTWAPVQTTAWLPFRPSLTLTLTPGAGARAVQAFVADAAGNVSLRPAVARFDVVPARDTLLSGQTRVFRRYLRAGETMTVRVTPHSGDPDLYLWDPRGQRVLVRNASGTAVDEGSIVASLAGWYQVEVEASSETTYAITMEVGTAGMSGLSEGSEPNAAKPLRTDPVVDVALEPADGVAVPSPPERIPAQLAIPAAFNRSALER